MCNLKGKTGERPGPELAGKRTHVSVTGGAEDLGWARKGTVVQRRAGDLISRGQSGPAIASDCQ